MIRRLIVWRRLSIAMPGERVHRIEIRLNPLRIEL
jgi:hypothetical protein